MTSIIWNHKFYHKRKAFPDFFKFVAWLVEGEEFVLLIDGRGFKVTLSHNGWAGEAVTSEYDGPEDRLNISHAPTKGEALEALYEKLKEAIYEEKI